MSWRLEVVGRCCGGRLRSGVGIWMVLVRRAIDEVNTEHRLENSFIINEKAFGEVSEGVDAHPLFECELASIQDMMTCKLSRVSLNHDQALEIFKVLIWKAETSQYRLYNPPKSSAHKAHRGG